jgi:hypothetical protein
MAGPGDPRYTQKIRAKRIELNYFKRPHPFRRWRFILSVAAPLVAALWLLVHAGQGDQRIYNSGTVSTAHQMFETDCKLCHGPGPATGATTLAAAMPTGYWARVSNNACTACHAGPAHHSNEQFSPPCASCHIEHKGRKFLVEAADQHCTQCHRDLKTKDGQPSAFHKTIGSFREHPEFAVGVRGADKVERVRLDAKDALRDTTPVKLNHARHLKPNLKGLEDLVKQLGTAGVMTVKDGQALGCTFCHRPDQNWQYMQPVTYAQHCAVCHELSTGIGDLVAPHIKPQLVHAFVRGTAGETFEACQSIPKGDAGKALREKCEGLGLAAAAPEPAAEEPRGRRRGGGDETPAAPAPEERPGRRRGGAALPMPDGLRGAWLRGGGDIILAQNLILAQDTPRGGRRRGEAAEEAPPADTPRGRRRGGDDDSTPAPGGGGGGGGASSAWVSQQLGGADKKLFGTKEDGCEKCHVFDRAAGAPVPEVIPPKIPVRWLPHSKFDHAPHRPLACGECHKASASSETKDVLLPGISSCRECHQPRGGARSGCVECHRYHDKSKERDADGPFKVPALLTGIGRKPGDRIR